MIVKKLAVFIILPILFFPSLICVCPFIQNAISSISKRFLEKNTAEVEQVPPKNDFMGSIKKRFFEKNTAEVEHVPPKNDFMKSLESIYSSKNNNEVRRVSKTDGFINKKVSISQGILVGSLLKSRNGRNFLAFQGIPYAQPPIDTLRFKNPVPAKAWSGEFKATSEPERCLQKNVNEHKMSDVIIGKEDCLYLNVYTPKTTNKKEKLMPVMFWIPGRGFSSGHGGLSSYGPHYLLDKDVVVVSINYRIGILGFLSTEDDILPGNYGMKDQVLALKWVKDNIERFGGDPSKVTIFGESSGGASVGLHLMSPLSKGLFHKAIMESGSPLSQWAVSQPGWAKRRAEELFAELRCNPQLLDECLRHAAAELLVEFQHDRFEWLMIPSVGFPPVVENCEKSEESFLCHYPLEDYVQESYVPVLLGMSSGEGGIYAANMFDTDGHVYPRLNKFFNYYLTSSMPSKYSPSVSDIKLNGEKIRSRYFPDGNMDEPLKAAKMINDCFFIRGIDDMAMKLSSMAYFYVYDHVNEYSLSFLFGHYPKEIDAIHSDEKISLFYIDGVPALQGRDLEISNLMVNMWTQFATTDELTIIDGTKKDTWPIFETTNMKYVLIQTAQTIISEKPYLNDYNFWNDIKESLKNSHG